MVHEVQKRVPNSLKLELQVIVNCYVGPGYWTCVLCKNIQCSQLLSHFSSSSPVHLTELYSMSDLIAWKKLTTFSTRTDRLPCMKVKTQVYADKKANLRHRRPNFDWWKKMEEHCLPISAVPNFDLWSSLQYLWEFCLFYRCSHLFTLPIIAQRVQLKNPKAQSQSSEDSCSKWFRRTCHQKGPKSKQETKGHGTYVEDKLRVRHFQESKAKCK